MSLDRPSRLDAQRTLFGPARDDRQGRFLTRHIFISDSVKANAGARVVAAAVDNGHVSARRARLAHQQAANRAGVVASNSRVSRRQRDEARAAQAVHKRWANVYSR